MTSVIHANTEHFNYKMVIAVRTDLKMDKGKIAAQVAHACVALTVEQFTSHRHEDIGLWALKECDSEWCKYYASWMEEGQKKVVVKVSSEEEINLIQASAEKIGIPNVIIMDAGKTQVEPGTVTCIGIGPASNVIIDEITKSLKLL